MKKIRKNNEKTAPSISNIKKQLRTRTMKKLKKQEKKNKTRKTRKKTIAKTDTEQG